MVQSDRGMSRISAINRPNPPITVNSNTTLDVSTGTVVADTSLLSFSIQLPDAAAFPNNVIYVKAPSANINALTLDAVSGQTIDGMTSVQLVRENDFVIVYSDGVNWNIQASGGSVSLSAGGIVGVNLVTPSSTTAHPTIASALASASPGDAVVVGPGTYAESVTVPAGVSLDNQPAHTATITGALATGTRVTLLDGALFSGFNVALPTDATAAISYASASSAHCTNIYISGNGGSGVGIRCASGRLLVRGGGYSDGAASTAILVDGGQLICENFNFYAGSLFAAFEINAGSLVTAQNIQFATNTSTNGFLVNGGSLDSEDVRYFNVGNGLHITADGTNINLRTPKFESTINNLLVDPGVTSGVLKVVSAQGDRSLITADPAYLSQETVAITFQDERLGDEAFLFFSEVSVGAPGFGRELSVGEGDSFTRGMVAFSASTPTSGFTDITNDLLLPDGNTVALMPGTGVGNTFYIGSDLPIAGIKVLLTTGMVLGATGAVSVEYSNATGGFTAFDTLSTQANFPYAAYGNAIFERAQSEQVRYDDIQSLNVPATVNGITKYWQRVTITSAITAVPVADQVKLSPNRTEINSDGFIEYFGRAEPSRLLNWHRRLEDDLAGASPLNDTLTLAQQITITPIDNEFAAGGLDGNGGIIPIPTGLDTSRELVYRFGWSPIGNLTGDVELELRYAVIRQGDVLDGTIPSTLTNVVVPISNQGQELIVGELRARVPEAAPGDFIAIAFFRDATAGNPDDTYPGNIEMVFVEIEGFFWR